MARLITGENEPTGMADLLGGDEELGMLSGKATGYCCVNFSLENNVSIYDQIYSEQYYYRYDQGVRVPDTYTAKAYECALWCSEYDCTSISNPDGVPMTRGVQGQSGWDNCIGSSNHGVEKNLEDLTCWWVLDFATRGRPGVIEDYDQCKVDPEYIRLYGAEYAGYVSDGFYCYTRMPDDE